MPFAGSALALLGCGTGLFCTLLGHDQVQGVDVSEPHLRLARRRMATVHHASYLHWRPVSGSAKPCLAVHNNSIEDYEAIKKRP